MAEDRYDETTRPSPRLVALGRRKARDSGMDLDQLRSQLLDERQALTALSDKARGSRDPVVLDQTSVGRLSRMDAMQVQAMAIESERRRQTRIKRIDTAIKRIDEGEFGYCARCGETIAERRLEADATTPFCTRCTGGNLSSGPVVQRRAGSAR